MESSSSSSSVINPEDVLECLMNDGTIDALRTPVLEKASKSVWELILDNNGLGKEISETVEKVFCRLSGQELPLFPPPAVPETLPPKEKENGQKEEGIASLKDNKSASKLKKRRHGEMDKEKGIEASARRSADLPPPPRPSKSPPTSKT
ncbi:hypothetical protein LINGRAHAP2_LOCUS19011 [Linum grandiflorum]